MKKNFFYFAMALCVALCTVSCGSDDGDDAPSYTPQKYEKEATAFTLEDRTASNVIGSGEIISITGLNFTESGKAIIETTHWKTGKTTVKYSTYDAEINGNEYIIKDGANKIGTVVNNGTRGSSEGVEITINITLSFDGGEPVKINPANPVAAVHMLEVNAASQGLTNITRTWQVERMKLTLDFDDDQDFSTEVSGGSLKPFQELAEEHNIILTEKDRTALNRSIVGLTLDKFGLFTVTYSDKFNDAAQWSWVVGSNDSKIKITLKDEEMGNKFLNSNANIDVKYPGDDKLILKVTVRLDEDKCTAYSTFNLK
jgi:hypothetical protein